MLQNYLAIVGSEAAITILSKRVSQISVQGWFMVDDDTWPPEQLKSFTPLLLIHYEGHHCSEQVAAIAKLMHTGVISSIATTDQISCVILY